MVNSRSGSELWIPRRFVGEVSRIDEPVLIVGLNRELELRSGMILPYQRRVIQMPVAGGAVSAMPGAGGGSHEPAPIVGIRLESNDKRIFKLIGATVVAAIALYFGASNFARQRYVYTFNDQTPLGLSRRDDYVAVARKLGKPAADREVEIGTIHYQALDYPDRKRTVILMGSDAHTTYIGAMDQNWKPTESADGSTAALLRNLKRF